MDEFTILQIIASARAYADNVVNEGRGAAQSAVGAVLAIGRDDISNPLPHLTISAPLPGDPGAVPQSYVTAFTDPGLNVGAPTIRTIPTLDLSGDPGAAPDVINLGPLDISGAPGEAPALVDILPLDISGAPGTAPTVAAYQDPGNRPTGPAGNTALIDSVPAIDTDVDIPDTPDLLARIEAITAPVLIPINIRTAPVYQPPPFLGTQPVDPGAPPSDLGATMRSEFNISAVMRAALTTEVDAYISKNFPGFAAGLAALETRLNTYLAGGTALTAPVQEAILARGVAKSDAEQRRARTKVYEESAMTGHSMPGPVTLGLVQVADQSRRDANNAVVRDLMVKIAEMEQTNMQFAVQQSSNLRVAMIQNSVSYAGVLVTINGQAVDYARSVVDAIVKGYGLSIQRSEIQARIYEAEATILRAKIEAALGQLHAYEAEVKAEEAKATVNAQLVALYREQIAAVSAEAQVYKSQADIIIAAAGLQKLKVDIYQATTSAYVAQVNGRTAEWNGYEAAVRGEIATVDASVAQVKGFTANSENYRNVIQARVAQIDGIARTNEARQKQYIGSLEAYRTIIGARVEQIKGIAMTNEANQKQFASEVDVWRAKISARVDEIKGIAISNESEEKVFTAGVDAYKKHVEALALVNKAEIDSFQATLSSYVAKANAISERSRADIASYEASLRAVVADSEMYFRLLHEKHELEIHKAEALARLGAEVSRNYAMVGQAALSSLNTLSANIVTG